MIGAPSHPTTSNVNSTTFSALTGSGLDQQIELNSKPMTLQELATTLKDLLEQRPDKTVFIKAPKDKQYGDIVAVIDTVKGAGAQPIGLQIDYLQ